MASITAASELNMVLVMGVTGSGKSYFVNKLADQDVVKVGDDLQSCTAQCSAVPVNIGLTKLLCIDTPGFDDSLRTDSQILEEIARILTAQHEAGVALKGVIYLHRITDVRYAGSSVKTLEIFKNICGPMALKNVMLVSTRWSEIDERTGAQREQQLSEDFWAYMLGHGATMARFYGSKESAKGIVSQLISRQSITLDLQRELAEGKTLKQTNAGAYVNDDLSEAKAKCEQELRDLEKLRQSLSQQNDRAMQRRYQQDQAREQQRLQIAYEDEERLRKEIAAEVRADIEGKKKSKGKGWLAAVPLLPAVIGIIEMFVGIPPGSTSLLTSWFSESGVGQSVSDFFANF